MTSPLLRKTFGVKLQYWHLGKSSVSKEEVYLEFPCSRLESATQLNSRSSSKLCSQHSIKTSVLCPWEALQNQSQGIPGVWVLLTDPSMSDMQKYQNDSLSQPSQRGRYRTGLKPNGRFQQTLANQFLFPFSLMMQKLYFDFLIFWYIDSIKVLPHWLLVWNKWTKGMIQSVKTTGTVSGKRMCSIITNCFDIAASLTIWLVSKGRQADGELGSHINNRTRSELMLRHNRRTIIGRSW